MVVRTSMRWTRGWNSKRVAINVPYVGQCGKFSAFRLVTWHCYPEQIVASLTSTVYTRLLKVWRGRKSQYRDVKRLDHELLLKVAALYVVNHSDYFMDRALAILHRPGPLQKLIHAFVRKLDDKFWFVYSQVSLQTYWLTFRSLGIRDKSRELLLRNFARDETKWHRNCLISEAFETAADTTCQVEFRRTPYVPVPKLRKSKIVDPTLLAFFEDWSDPD